MSQIKTKFIQDAAVTGAKIETNVALAGSPTTTTQTSGDNSTKIATTAYADAAGGGGANDIATTAFAAANNQVTFANVTGLAFANGSVRSFKALVDVHVDATADLFETFEIIGIQRGADWQISSAAVGDDSLVDLQITTAGQIQYTSGNYTGFVSITIHFRAWANDI